MNAPSGLDPTYHNYTNTNSNSASNTSTDARADLDVGVGVPQAGRVARASYRIPLYLDASVSVNFAASNNKTVQPVPLYGSAYLESSGLDFITVQMSHVDTYLIHIEVRYSQYVNQTVVISFLGGNLTVSPEDFQLQWDMCSMGFDLDLEITTRIAPTIPSAEEIADAQMYRFNTKIDNATKHMNMVTEANQSAVMFAIVLAAPSVFGTLGLAVLVLREREKRIRLEEQVHFERQGGL